MRGYTLWILVALIPLLLFSELSTAQCSARGSDRFSTGSDGEISYTYQWYTYDGAPENSKRQALLNGDGVCLLDFSEADPGTAVLALQINPGDFEKVTYLTSSSERVSFKKAASQHFNIPDSYPQWTDNGRSKNLIFEIDALNASEGRIEVQIIYRDSVKEKIYYTYSSETIVLNYAILLPCDQMKAIFIENSSTCESLSSFLDQWQEYACKEVIREAEFKLKSFQTDEQVLAQEAQRKLADAQDIELRKRIYETYLEDVAPFFTGCNSSFFWEAQREVGRLERAIQRLSLNINPAEPGVVRVEFSQELMDENGNIILDLQTEGRALKQNRDFLTLPVEPEANSPSTYQQIRIEGLAKGEYSLTVQKPGSELSRTKAFSVNDAPSPSLKVLPSEGAEEIAFCLQGGVPPYTLYYKAANETAYLDNHALQLDGDRHRCVYHIPFDAFIDIQDRDYVDFYVVDQEKHSIPDPDKDRVPHFLYSATALSNNGGGGGVKTLLFILAGIALALVIVYYALPRDNIWKQYLKGRRQ